MTITMKSCPFQEKTAYAGFGAYSGTNIYLCAHLAKAPFHVAIGRGEPTRDQYAESYEVRLIDTLQYTTWGRVFVMSFAFFRALCCFSVACGLRHKRLLWGQWGALSLQSHNHVLLPSRAFLNVEMGDGGVAEHSASNNRTRLT